MVLNLIIFSLLSIVYPETGSESLYEKNYKRANKALEKLWEDELVQVDRINLDRAIMADKQLDPLELYAVSTINQPPKAYLCLVKAPSKVDTFTFMIIYNLDLTIRHVELLEYKENYGGEISSKRFLRQFQGKSGADHMELGQDIDGISGATISVQSIIRGIRILNKEMIVLKTLGLI